MKGATSCAGATGAQNSPLCTLDSALAKLPSGGFIRVLGSTTALGQANTTITKPYVVVGDGSALVTIKGTQVAGPAPLHLLYYPSAFTVGAAGALYLEAWASRHRRCAIASCDVAVAGSAKMSLYNVFGAGLNGFGAKSVGCTLTIDRMWVNTSTGGITVTGGSIQQLSNAMLIENSGTGVYIGAGTVLPAAGLVYLTVVQNGASGMTAPGGIDCEVPTSIVNSIVQLNNGPNYGGAGGCVFTYSDTSPAPSGAGNDNIAVTFGPGPSPPTNDAWDYHLRGNQGMNDSCCVDKGIVIPSVTHDIDGQPRPDGPAPPISAATKSELHFPVLRQSTSPRALRRLAVRAEVAVVPVHAGLANLVATARADGAQSNLQEVADLVLGGRLALRDLVGGGAHHAHDLVVEAVHFFGCEGAAARLRVDARGEQDLVGVGVAERVDGVLVHEEHAHLVAARARERAERFARELWTEEVEPAVRQSRDLVSVPCAAKEVDLAHLFVVEVAVLQVLDLAEAEREAERSFLPIGRQGASKTPREHRVHAELECVSLFARGPLETKEQKVCDAFDRDELGANEVLEAAFDERAQTIGFASRALVTTCCPRACSSMLGLNVEEVGKLGHRE